MCLRKPGSGFRLIDLSSRRAGSGSGSPLVKGLRICPVRPDRMLLCSHAAMAGGGGGGGGGGR